MKERLSRVYLDDYPITLMGDEATPPLSRIVRAGGKVPDLVDVVYLTSPSDRTGRPVEPEEIIDRTAEPTRPIYLRTRPRDVKPIRTVHADAPGLGLSPPDLPARPTSRSPMPNVDPVISQLGGPSQEPSEDRPHKKAVFRSPSQLADAAALADPAPDVTPKLRRAKRAKSSKALATAEAEAEQRQEDERNWEDALQDEQEADDAAADDAKGQT